MPKYSFIVPVYNSGPYLEPCVSSLLAQTCQNFEILLIDDGSTDGSGAVCDRLGETHPQIRVFHKENGGVASARNFGIDQAEGEFLLFIDGDDTVEPDYLECANRLLQDHTIDMVVMGMSFDFYEHGVLIRNEVHAMNDGIMERKAWRESVLELFAANSLSSSCNKVLSAKCIKKHNLRFDEQLILYEDLHFSINYSKYVDRIAFISHGYYHYRINLDNNRYYKRISDTDRVNLMLQELRTSMEYLTESASWEIRCNILAQIMTEVFISLAYHPYALKEKAQAFCLLSEFNVIHKKFTKYRRNVPFVYSAVAKKHYSNLWIWSMYRSCRQKLRKIIKKCLVKRNG